MELFCKAAADGNALGDCPFTHYIQARFLLRTGSESSNVHLPVKPAGDMTYHTVLVTVVSSAYPVPGRYPSVISLIMIQSMEGYWDVHVMQGRIS